MPYAVCDYGSPLEGVEIKVLGFRLSLPEAFAMLMAHTVVSYRFERDQHGVMRLQIKAHTPRESLPCDYAVQDHMASTNPDDEAARDEIMQSAGENVWHGLSLVEHPASLASPDVLKAEIEAVSAQWARDHQLGAA